MGLDGLVEGLLQHSQVDVLEIGGPVVVVEVVGAGFGLFVALGVFDVEFVELIGA